MRSLLFSCLLLAPIPAVAGDELGALLEQIAPDRPAPTGQVEVQGWLERSSAGTELVVTLTPTGSAKLVADPGLTVTPLAKAGAAAPGEPLQLSDPSRDYLDQPPVVRLPLPRHTGGTVEAKVDYAYCLVHYICLFGEKDLRVEDATGGAGS